MILFFGTQTAKVYAVETHTALTAASITKLNWLFGDAQHLNKSALADFFVGPRAAMITPWSTNAVEITQTMGIKGIIRIEEFLKVDSHFMNLIPCFLRNMRAWIRISLQ
jgi:phosphoribosylformylglycinamidine synthase